MHRTGSKYRKTKIVPTAHRILLGSEKLKFLCAPLSMLGRFPASPSLNRTQDCIHCRAKHALRKMLRETFAPSARFFVTPCPDQRLDGERLALGRQPALRIVACVALDFLQCIDEALLGNVRSR